MSGKRIFVGLSGGVDSAVTAALLQKAGANVVGVFIKGWYPPGQPCSWASDRRDAMRVAAALSIPFTTLDASETYKKGVIDYLLSEYGAGRTPNPDIMCNREVKFGAFLEYARSKGADAIATGHYARRVDADDGAALYRGKDRAKDQSYFLWAIGQDALSYSLFPLGDMEKSDVRALARRFSLPVAEKRDSQGICFLGSVSVDEWLRAEFGTVPGIAVDENGKEIGKHEGVLLSTLGERVRLTEAASGPWFVTKKDIEQNILVVSKKLSTNHGGNRIQFSTPQMFAPIVDGEEVSAQYRYHGPIILGHVEGSAFIPKEPLPEPVAPGQSIVFYRGERCIGGGIINE